MFKRNFHPMDCVGNLTQSFLSRVDDGRNVRVIPLSSDRAYPPLPSPHNFTLDAQLAAGVPLQEVDSVLLNSSEKILFKLLTYKHL